MACGTAGPPIPAAGDPIACRSWIESYAVMSRPADSHFRSAAIILPACLLRPKPDEEREKEARRRVLELLASSQDGCTEAILIAGFCPHSLPQA